MSFNKENGSITNKCIVRFFGGICFKILSWNIVKEDFLYCYFLLHLLWTMTNASKFNLQEGEKSFNEQIYIVSITSCVLDLWSCLSSYHQSQGVICNHHKFFSIYLMLVFCFTIANIKLGYLQARISHHCSLIGLAFFNPIFKIFFHIVVDVHCHHLWMSKQRIIDLFIWIIIKSCDA